MDFSGRLDLVQASEVRQGLGTKGNLGIYGNWGVLFLRCPYHKSPAINWDLYLGPLNLEAPIWKLPKNQGRQDTSKNY